MGIQPAYVINADVILELLPSLAPFFKEVRTKPDLFKMSFMGVLSQYLLYGYFSFSTSMHSQPNNAKPSPSKQSKPLEVLRKAFSKFIILISRQIGSYIKIAFLSIPLINLNGFLLLILGLRY